MSYKIATDKAIDDFYNIWERSYYNLEEIDGYGISSSTPHCDALLDCVNDFQCIGKYYSGCSDELGIMWANF